MNIKNREDELTTVTNKNEYFKKYHVKRYERNKFKKVYGGRIYQNGKYICICTYIRVK